jgi:hypothetical protein
MPEGEQQRGAQKARGMHEYCPRDSLWCANQLYWHQLPQLQAICRAAGPQQSEQEPEQPSGRPACACCLQVCHAQVGVCSHGPRPDCLFLLRCHCSSCPCSCPTGPPGTDSSCTCRYACRCSWQQRWTVEGPFNSICLQEFIGMQPAA